MTKAVSLSLGFILLLASAAALPAQTSPTDMAVNQAVLDQANTIVLRQKLVDAKSAAARGRSCHRREILRGGVCAHAADRIRH